jgi:hypothetical protein
MTGAPKLRSCEILDTLEQVSALVAFCWTSLQQHPSSLCTVALSVLDVADR